MTKLLIVSTCATGAEISKLLWPAWRDCGADEIAFVVGDKPCWVPEGVRSVQSGVDKYVNRDNPDDNLARRICDELEVFLKSSLDLLCAIEYDCWLGRLPDSWSGFSGTWFERQFVHKPYLFDRETASLFLSVGSQMIAHGEFGRGWPDRFAADIANSLCIDSTHTGNMSANTLDNAKRIAEARGALARGSWGIHGVKTAEQLEAVLA